MTNKNKKTSFNNSKTFTLLFYRKYVLSAYNSIAKGELNHKALKKVFNFVESYNNKNINVINRDFMMKLMLKYNNKRNIDYINKEDILNELNRTLVTIQKYINNI